MATPRVFISSTYYDLRNVREDLASFIRQLGYEPVMHEKGGVSYTQDRTLEQSCYDEISTCDILVCVIGNKYGSQSELSEGSITMTELKKALSLKKTIYIYIVKDVYIENNTYLMNVSNNAFKPNYVDNIKIHEFIAELKKTLRNNPIEPFDTVSDIIEDLRTQFAGLLQRLLSIQAAATAEKTYYDLLELSTNIKQSYKNHEEIQDELYKKLNSFFLYPSAIITRLLSLFGFQDARFSFTNIDGLIELMEKFGYTLEANNEADFYHFSKNDEDKIKSVYISTTLFNSDKSVKRISKQPDIEKLVYFNEEVVDDDDELPF